MSSGEFQIFCDEGFQGTRRGGPGEPSLPRFAGIGDATWARDDQAARGGENIYFLLAHLKKLKEYEMQFIFYADGWFLLHCITTLLNNGKLKLPPEEQKKSLMTLIYPQ